MTKEPSWWTEARVDELKARWHRGETASAIARTMHAASRNAIISKAHRLELEIRATAHNNGAKAATDARRHSGRVRLIYCDGRYNKGEQSKMVAEAPTDFKNPKSIMALRDGDCRWPGAGCGAAMLYCAAPVKPGYSYCARHCRLAYVKPGSTPRGPR